MVLISFTYAVYMATQKAYRKFVNEILKRMGKRVQIYLLYHVFIYLFFKALLLSGLLIYI